MAPPSAEDAEAMMAGAAPSPAAFSVLHDKALPVERVALCPKMDLAAVLMADGALSVVRTISWQRLHAIPAAELQDEHRITALAWSPDGNVVALGHARGSLSLLDIGAAEPAPQPVGFRPDTNEQSEVSALAWLAQHKAAGALGAADREKERTAASARYYLHRDDVFLEDLPALGQGAGGAGAAGAASSFADTRERKEDPIGVRLAAATPGLDVLVAGFQSGGVLLLAAGIFPLLSLRVQDHIPPSLLPHLPPMTPSPGGGRMTPSPMPPPPTATPAMGMVTPARPSSAASPSTPASGGSGKKRPLARVTAVSAPADLGALTLALEAAGAGGQPFLLALPTPALWRNRHQLKPVAAEFAALGALMEHVQGALDQGERLWKDSTRVLDMKLELLNNLLRDYGCPASAREAFLSLVLTGVPCPALNQYLSQNSSEPQRHNTFRLAKAVDEKCAALEALLREQVGRVAEMIVFRASKLRGLARVGDEYQEIGLSAAALSTLVEAAVRLGLKAEEALREVQAARQSLRVFLLWLLDTMQHHHLKEEGGANAAAQPPKGGGGGFRHVAKHVKLLLAFLRKRPFPPPPGGGGPKPGNTEAIVGVRVSAYFRDGPLPLHLPPQQQQGDAQELHEQDELASVSLRTQVQALRAAFDAVFRRPADALRTQLGPARAVRLPASTASTPPAFGRPLHATGAAANGPTMVLCALVSPERATLLVVDPLGKSPASAVLLAAVSLAPPPGRRWQQAALYGPEPLVPSQNEEALVLLARGAPSGSGRASAELWKLPLAGLRAAMAPVQGGGDGAGGLGLGLQGVEVLGGPAEVEGAKGRELSQMAPEALRLAVTGSRGVATVASRVNYLCLVDMEEDEEEDEEDEDEEEEEEEGGEAMDEDEVEDEEERAMA